MKIIKYFLYLHGKNLNFKNGNVDPVHCDELLNMIQEKKMSTNQLITHSMSISQSKETFNNKIEFLY